METQSHMTMELKPSESAVRTPRLAEHENLGEETCNRVSLGFQKVPDELRLSWYLWAPHPAGSVLV